MSNKELLETLENFYHAIEEKLNTIEKVFENSNPSNSDVIPTSFNIVTLARNIVEAEELVSKIKSRTKGHGLDSPYENLREARARFTEATFKYIEYAKSNGDQELLSRCLHAALVVAPYCSAEQGGKILRELITYFPNTVGHERKELVDAFATFIDNAFSVRRNRIKPFSTIEQGHVFTLYKMIVNKDPEVKQDDIHVSERFCANRLHKIVGMSPTKTKDFLDSFSVIVRGKSDQEHMLKKPIAQATRAILKNIDGLIGKINPEFLNHLWNSYGKLLNQLVEYGSTGTCMVMTYKAPEILEGLYSIKNSNRPSGKIDNAIKGCNSAIEAMKDDANRQVRNAIISHINGPHAHRHQPSGQGR